MSDRPFAASVFLCLGSVVSMVLCLVSVVFCIPCMLVCTCICWTPVLSHVSCMLCTSLHVTMYYRSHPHLHTHTRYAFRHAYCMHAHCSTYLSADSSAMWTDSLTHTKLCHVQVLGMRLIRKAHLAPGHHECAYMSYKPSERDGTWIELLLSDPSKVSV